MAIGSSSWTLDINLLGFSYFLTMKCLIHFKHWEGCDMGNEQCNLHDPNCHGPHFGFFKRISWSAIIAGALVGIGLTFLLNLFSIAIGLSIVKTTTDGMTILAVGGLVGVLIGTIVANFVGGMSAGYLGRPFCPKGNLGVLYGFVTWFLALLLMAMIFSKVGNFVEAYTSFIQTPVTVVKIVNNETTPAVSSAIATIGKTKPVTVNVQAATNNLGIAATIVFILFWLGAISSCVGGHYGMVCRDSCCPEKKCE